MAPYRNHVEARSSKKPARQYVSETHDHKPDAPSRYRPCHCGIHVCGADEAANEFFTLANYPQRSIEASNAAFERARKECEAAPDEPTEFVVDLMSCGDTLDDFRITRQMLPRLAKAIAGVSS